MNLVSIKPLSVNKAWKGRRFKTDAYKSYERSVKWLLPDTLDIPDGRLQIYLKFGFSSKASDLDNPVKPFVDVLQKKYGFDDKRIRRAIIDVDDSCKKGEEYIEFELTALVA